MRKASTPKIVRAPRKPATAEQAAPQPATTPRATTAKPKRLTRPRPTPKPIPTPLLGPPGVVSLPTPTLEPVVSTPTPTEPPATPSVVEWSATGGEPQPTAASVVEWAAAGGTPPVEPPAPEPVESSTTGEPLAAPTPPAVQPDVPALVLPQGQSASDISSVQVGDTLILVMKVQPVPTVDGTSTTESTP